jgi:hypothetical protein
VTAATPEYIVARRVLLDALDALGPQARSVVLVGAQAVYLRAGDGGLAVTPHTIDADLGLRPELIAAAPELSSCMTSAGFAHSKADSVGIWVTRRTIAGRSVPVAVDLLVAEAVAGTGSRAARIPPHDDRTARRVRGIEGALFDHDAMVLSPLEPSDLRRREILVAGPAALLVAKAHKVKERLAGRGRAISVAKDALDIVRLLRGCPEPDTAARLRRLLAVPGVADDLREATANVTREAIDFLRREFAVAAGRGCSLAADAAVGAMESPELVASTVELTRNLLRRIDPTLDANGGTPSPGN